MPEQTGMTKTSTYFDCAKQDWLPTPAQIMLHLSAEMDANEADGDVPTIVIFCESKLGGEILDSGSSER
jgi:hypothetical protein